MNRSMRKILAWALALMLVLSSGLANAATSNEIFIIVPDPSPAVLSIEMTAGATVEPGKTVQYSVTLRSRGGASKNVTAETELPAGLTVVDSSTVNCTKQSAVKVSATFAEIPADGSVSYSFNATAADTLSGGTKLEAVSTLTSDEALHTARAVTRVVESVLSIQKTVNTLLPAKGETIQYTLNVSNAGEMNATNARVVDTLPADLTPSNIAGGGVWDAAARTITWDVSIPAGDQQSLAYSATVGDDVPTGKTLRNTATVAPQDGLVVDQDSVTVTVGGPTLSLRKQVSDQWPEPGDKLTYTLTVENLSDYDATDVLLTDTLPKGLKLNLDSVRAGGGEYESGLVSWYFDLAANARKQFTIVCYVPDDAVIGTKFKNVANLGDLTDSATSTVYEGEPILEIRKLVNNTTPEPGSTVRYTVRVRNVGDADAYDVDILDTVPYDLVVRESTITHDGWLDEDENRVYWTIDVPQGETVTLRFRAYVPEFCEDGDRYVNRARIVGGDGARVTITVTDGAVPKTGEIDETDLGLDPEALVIAPANPIGLPVAAIQAAADDAEPEGEGVRAPEISTAFAQALSQNPDVIGRLIAGDQIDEPVLFRDNDYYMYNNIDGVEDENGALFMDEHNSVWPQDTNILIYGHNMKSGRMFGTLSRFRELAYLQAHPIVQFQTIYDAEPVSYAIIAVLDASMNEGNAEYVKIRRPNFDDETETDFATYLQGLTDKSYFQIPVETLETDKLVTLVTCSYSLDNGRLLVVARKLRDGETVESITEFVAQATAK